MALVFFLVMSGMSNLPSPSMAAPAPGSSTPGTEFGNPILAGFYPDPGICRVGNDYYLVNARNTLTQRTFGPESAATAAVDVSNLKDGDFAGLALLQKNYGLVGVTAEGGTNYVVMVDAGSGRPAEVARIPLRQTTVYLKAECDFKNRADTERFFYSLDGRSWTSIGTELKMRYTIPHFMGYRFGLFSYATKNPGGFADFDFFRVSDQISASP